MNIYFDTCALNRLSDDQSQTRIRTETDAMQRLLDLVVAKKVRWVTSTVLRFELSANSDPVRRIAALSVLEFSDEVVSPSPATKRRALELQALGYRGLDATHLALAEEAGVDWLVTTDDRFLRLAIRDARTALPDVINPVDLVQRRFPWLLQHNP